MYNYSSPKRFDFHTFRVHALNLFREFMMKEKLSWQAIK